MPAPRYVTSDVTGAPGVYIREVVPTAPVRGIVNNTVAIVGQCVRGPIGRGVEITSYARFTEVYGERDYGAGGAIVGEVWKALINKPMGKLVIFRTAAAAAVKASFTLESAAGGAGTALLRIDASSPGAWANSVRHKVSAASDGNANHFNLEVRYLTRRKLYENVDISATGNDNTLVVLGDDDGNLITLTKLADGRPNNTAPGVDGADTEGFILLGQVVAGFTAVAGADGSIADSDFTVANGPIEQANGYKGVGVAMVAGRSNTAVKAKVLTMAAATPDRLWLICPDSSAVSMATALTERATLVNKNLVYCFNHPLTLDPATAVKITVEPTSWLASDLGQTDPDTHPGDADNRDRKAGIAGLTYENLNATDYDSLDAGCITALERDEEGKFTWVSGVTTDPTNKQIDLRRMKFFLFAGIAQFLKQSVYKANTRTRRANDRGAVLSFLTGLAKRERFIAIDSDGQVQAQVLNEDEVNTDADRAAGRQNMLVRAKTIAKNLAVGLLVSVGPDVNITVTEVV
jgi:hypothetical protein